MPKERPTDHAVGRILNRLSDMKARRDRIQKLLRTKDHEDWPDFKAVLEEQAKMRERSIESLVENGGRLDDHERVKSIDITKAERDVFRWVVALIDRPQESVDVLNDLVEQLESDLAAKRQELKDLGPVEAS